MLLWVLMPEYPQQAGRGGQRLWAHSAGAGATPAGTGQTQGRGREGSGARRAQKVLQAGLGGGDGACRGARARCPTPAGGPGAGFSPHGHCHSSSGAGRPQNRGPGEILAPVQYRTSTVAGAGHVSVPGGEETWLAALAGPCNKTSRTAMSPSERRRWLPSRKISQAHCLLKDQITKACGGGATRDPCPSPALFTRLEITEHSLKQHL